MLFAEKCLMFPFFLRYVLYEEMCKNMNSNERQRYDFRIRINGENI